MVKSSNYPVLEAGYGVLNPSYGSLSGKNYDTQEVGFFGLARKSIENSMGPNALSGMGPMIGIVLRVEGFTNQHGTMDPTSWVGLSGQGINKDVPADSVGLLQLRIRVPEIHACLPIPADLPESTVEDPNHAIINMYPIYTSQTVRTSQEIPPPGSLVWIDYQNRDTKMGPIFLGAVDNTAVAPPTTEEVTPTEAHGKRVIYEVTPEIPETGGTEDTYADPSIRFAGNQISQRSKRLLRDSPIPDGYVVTGKGYPEIVDACQTELNFWQNGKIKEPPKNGYEPDINAPLGQRSARLYQYWMASRIGGSTIIKKMINERSPWSAAFICYVLYNADFVRRASHNLYTKANENTDKWKLYSLLEDQAEKIKVSPGDVLVYPTFASGGRGHGDVVWKIIDNTAVLVGGNLANSCKVASQYSPIQLNPNGTIQNPSVYTLILKRRSKQIPAP
tara:strand:- start:317 stop:1657 length:1341 start_codon:yes stop_codon:yes gene_type:complete